MALFGSSRDASLIKSINRELINRFIDTEVAFYKLSLMTRKLICMMNLTVKLIMPQCGLTV